MNLNNLYKEITNIFVEDANPSFDYQLLGRLKSDCDYYLGMGGRHSKHLWAGDVKGQIKKMKELYNSFPKDKKPEWLTMNQILDYERKMMASPTKDSNEYDIKKVVSRKRYKGHEIKQVLLKDGRTEFWVYTEGSLDWEAGTLKEAKDFIDSY